MLYIYMDYHRGLSISTTFFFVQNTALPSPPPTNTHTNSAMCNSYIGWDPWISRGNYVRSGISNDEVEPLQYIICWVWVYEVTGQQMKDKFQKYHWTNCDTKYRIYIYRNDYLPIICIITTYEHLATQVVWTLSRHQRVTMVSSYFSHFSMFSAICCRTLCTSLGFAHFVASPALIKSHKTTIQMTRSMSG